MERTMRNGGLDLLLVLTVVLALGTIIQDYRFDSSMARDRAAAAVLDRELGSLEVTVAHLSAAATSSLALDQAPEVWTRQISDLAGQLDAAVSDLRASSTNPDVRMRYDAATSALADVLTIDRRARDALRSNQRSLAAGLVRVDSRDAADRLAGELAAARAAEDAARTLRLTRLARLRFGMNAVTIGWVVLVALYASRLAKHPAVSPAATMAQMLRELPPPVKAPAPVRAASPPPPAPAPAATPAPAPAPAPSPAVHLSAAADLCVDLARLIDSRDLPALLERTVKVLEAKGVIIWTADRDGTSLRPSLTHGYSERVLARLGTLRPDGDNVTSLSFRSASPQTMSGMAPGEPGAIAVPLLTAAGCTGVLAVEVRDSNPASELTALATIIAAQFSTLIGPGDRQVPQAAEA
jgi:hypothetical protein